MNERSIREASFEVNFQGLSDRLNIDHRTRREKSCGNVVRNLRPDRVLLAWMGHEGSGWYDVSVVVGIICTKTDENVVFWQILAPT